MTYAAHEDVSGRLGRSLSPDEIDLVEIRLADVERLILRRIPDLVSKVDTNVVDVEDVRQVEADAVLRLIRNPDGLISESDGNYSYLRHSALASGKLEILPEDWTALGWRRSSMTTLVPTFSRPASAELTYNEYVALKFATGG